MFKYDHVTPSGMTSPDENEELEELDDLVKCISDLITLVRFQFLIIYLVVSVQSRKLDDYS